MHTAIAELEQAQIRDDVPDFRPGDTLKVHVRVKEGNRSRIQVFQGVVIRRQGAGLRETFTIRKVSFGVGVERTFPVHSPTIAKIEVATLGDVRRAKLYYLRERHGKAAKIKERRVARGKAAAAQSAAEAAVDEVDEDDVLEDDVLEDELVAEDLADVEAAEVDAADGDDEVDEVTDAAPDEAAGPAEAEGAEEAADE